MSIFKKGDKVVCIDVSSSINREKLQFLKIPQKDFGKELKLYEIYTVNDDVIGTESITITESIFIFSVKRFIKISEFRRLKIKEIFN